MELDELLILLERAAESIKFLSPDDVTQFAYNEGIADLAIAFEDLIKNKIDK